MKTQTKKRSGYRPKIESRSIKCLFIGYDTFDYTYRVYTLDEHKIICSRDRAFDEHASLETPSDTSSINQLIDDNHINEDVDDEADLHQATNSQEEPTCYQDAINSPDACKWIEAMKNEFDSLIKNNTWVPVDLPKGRKRVTAKWVFKIKKNSDGSIDEYKARYVARGFTQKLGIDYHGTFSSVARMESIRTLLVIANQFNLNIIQMDVKTAFL